jgi:6-pyruvoyltetrahydropterin/6-carboxytetrahydropterin synthase
VKTLVSKSWRFDACHKLENHDGKCAQWHGHTYTLTVGVTGEPRPLDGQPDEGMVVDFGRLDDVWKAELEPLLDHRDINDTLGHLVGRTTSEQIAEWAYGVFDACFTHGNHGDPTSRRVAFVRVSETPTTYAEVRG